MKHLGRPSGLSLKSIIERSSFIQEDIIKMAPIRVDPNKKQAKLSIDQVEEDPFYLDRMARTVNSFLSQATVDYAMKTSRVLYYECLDDGEAQQI